MYLWVDDERKPPMDKNIHWVWARTVDEAKVAITFYKRQYWSDFIYIDLDHDAGDYRKHGGDYIRLLDWLERMCVLVDNTFRFHIHTMNPVGRENMQAIIRRNGWWEVP